MVKCLFKKAPSRLYSNSDILVFLLYWQASSCTVTSDILAVVKHYWIYIKRFYSTRWRSTRQFTSLIYSIFIKGLAQKQFPLLLLLVKGIIQIMCSGRLQPLKDSEIILNNRRRILFLSLASKTLSSNASPAQEAKKQVATSPWLRGLKPAWSSPSTD